MSYEKEYETFHDAIRDYFIKYKYSKGQENENDYAFFIYKKKKWNNKEKEFLIGCINYNNSYVSWGSYNNIDNSCDYIGM